MDENDILSLVLVLLSNRGFVQMNCSSTETCQELSYNCYSTGAFWVYTSYKVVYRVWSLDIYDHTIFSFLQIVDEWSERN